MYGDLGFSGDFGGQLSNRFFYKPGDPVLPDPTNPLPEPVVNPDLFGINGRQYRVNGNAGVSIRSGARSTISLTAGASHAFSNGQQQGRGLYELFRQRLLFPADFRTDQCRGEHQRRTPGFQAGRIVDDRESGPLRQYAAERGNSVPKARSA